ncbi:SDR family oxidoreductase [Novosphingobium sp. G106]|uniref:SDR family NAD(P)-dependent oxidoreductase n=1 Tax=Novosphingobium sp. G106 TaxID=2849500 RepID=UPI001C2DB822|nr:SDR family oxidoreductase [Novosphingobium sp. G106]MBV1686776.1 SDR family oxidoreductase [Novosphingobium sp. G106]
MTHRDSEHAAKVAVVTGGGSGIGRAIALRLARDGIAVAVWGRTASSTDETVEMIAQQGGTAIACIGDATCNRDIERSLRKTHEILGPVSILVNNAGMAEHCPFLEIRESDFQEMLRVNVIGPFLCTQAVLPDMLAGAWGRIVNITSSIMQDGIGAMAHYAASKGGLAAMTKDLAIEVADRGVTVNHLPVFFVDTPMMRAAPLDMEAVAAAVPMKRAGRVEEVAAACAYLVSEEAAYVTGQPLSLNGGRYLA